MKKIYIFDTTLRDGEQTPGAKLNTVEKIEIAKQLESLGVDVIEAGFPISSPQDFEAIKQVSSIIKNSTVCALARGIDKDIDIAYESIKDAASPRIHTFISASDIHIKYQMKKTHEEVLEMVKNAVRRAKKYVSNVEFSPMDASRADFEYLVKFINTAIDAGATTINIPDTVGYAIPEEWGAMIKKLVEKIPRFTDDIVLSVHTHNDLGLATANALAGVVNGASQIECTINGTGERAGNCSLEEVVMAIKTRYAKQFSTGVNTVEIYKTSRMVSQLMGMPVQPNKAIVGSNAFAHSSGIHQDGIIKKRENFEIIDPKDIGLESSEIVLTARSGRAALQHRLAKIGYNFTKEQIEPFYQQFLEMADNKKEVYDEDLHLLMSGTKNKKVINKYELEQIQVLCGNKNVPMTMVKIKTSKETLEGIATGTGPIDASYKAIDTALNTQITLKEYLVQAVTEGMDAVGKVTVKIVDNNKNKEYFGFGSDDDIIVASAKAYIDAINKIA